MLLLKYKLNKENKTLSIESYETKKSMIIKLKDEDYKWLVGLEQILNTDDWNIEDNYSWTDLYVSESMIYIAPSIHGFRETIYLNPHELKNLIDIIW